MFLLLCLWNDICTAHRWHTCSRHSISYSCASYACKVVISCYFCAVPFNGKYGSYSVSIPFFVVLTFAWAWRFLLSLYFCNARKLMITASVTDTIIKGEFLFPRYLEMTFQMIQSESWYAHEPHDCFGGSFWLMKMSIRIQLVSVPWEDNNSATYSLLHLVDWLHLQIADATRVSILALVSHQLREPVQNLLGHFLHAETDAAPLERMSSLQRAHWGPGVGDTSVEEDHKFFRSLNNE